MKREKETSKKTFKIGLTLTEKTKKRQKSAQNSVTQIETAVKKRKISRETQKKTTTKKINNNF
jgi:hypothetical protein